MWFYRKVFAHKGQVLNQIASNFWMPHKTLFELETGNTRSNGNRRPHVWRIPCRNGDTWISLQVVHGENIRLAPVRCVVWNFTRRHERKSKIPNLIITPTTKADEGHDENISREEIIEQGLVSKEDYEMLEKYTMALFLRGTEMAAEKGPVS